MIKAFQLIFSPFETWEKITIAQRGVLWTLGVHLLPLLVLALGLEAYLLTQWGEKRNEFGSITNVPFEAALRYGLTYLVILLAAVIIGAKFLSLASDSFNVHATYLQSFTVMAYAFGPIILARMLDGFPQINTWVCWALGAAGAVSVLYHGIGMVLKPDQTKGFGLYLIAVIIIVLVSGLAHFAALAMLHGKAFRLATAEVTTTLVAAEPVAFDAFNPSVLSL